MREKYIFERIRATINILILVGNIVCFFYCDLLFTIGSSLIFGVISYLLTETSYLIYKLNNSKNKKGKRCSLIIQSVISETLLSFSVMVALIYLINTITNFNDSCVKILLLFLLLIMPFLYFNQDKKEEMYQSKQDFLFRKVAAIFLICSLMISVVTCAFVILISNKISYYQKIYVAVPLLILVSVGFFNVFKLYSNNNNLGKLSNMSFFVLFFEYSLIFCVSIIVLYLYAEPNGEITPITLPKSDHIVLTIKDNQSIDGVSIIINAFTLWTCYVVIVDTYIKMQSTNIIENAKKNLILINFIDENFLENNKESIKNFIKINGLSRERGVKYIEDKIIEHDFDENSERLLANLNWYYLRIITLHSSPSKNSFFCIIVNYFRKKIWWGSVKYSKIKISDVFDTPINSEMLSTEFQRVIDYYSKSIY